MKLNHINKTNEIKKSNINNKLLIEEIVKIFNSETNFKK
jgi:hypothetical protein